MCKEEQRTKSIGEIVFFIEAEIERYRQLSNKEIHTDTGKDLTEVFHAKTQALCEVKEWVNRTYLEVKRG
tara:strand:+ start:522 stop:731 length:210 start_codon:yes stop_codon:yes gene_type:complete